MINPQYHISPSIFDHILDRLESHMRTRGIHDTVKHVKQIRTGFLLALRGQKEKGIVYLDGYPRILGHKQIKEQKEEKTIRTYVIIRLILTILYSTRAFSIGVDPDFDPITKPGTGIVIIDQNEVKSFWKILGYSAPRKGEHKVPDKVRFSNYHFTTKAGPNGHAQWTVWDDLLALPPSLQEAIKTIGGDELIKRIDLLLEYKYVFHKRTSNSRIRKLSFIRDKEDKVRVIAIQDYWSQTAQRPLHLFLFKMLKRIPQDCTFNQGKLLEALARNPGKKYSCDLSAATDRFPIDFIAKVLEGRFPSQFVKAWKYILVGNPFLVDIKGRNPFYINYGVGNPMGAYTSWASFALAHHFLVYSCCKEAGVAWRKCAYALLGDDIVIADEKVAEIYQRRIQQLGVEVSISKSHISYEMFEFAKRIFYNGVEVSPFPISALQSTSSRSYLLIEVLMEAINRGWAFPSLEYSLAGFYETVFGSNASYRATVTNIGFIVSRQRLAISGLYPGPEFLKEFCARKNIPQRYTVTQEDFERILSFAAVDSFADSEGSFNNEDNDLGAFALSEVIRLTSDPNLPQDQPSYHPTLYAHGLVSEMLGDQYKTARAISNEGRDWPTYQKVIALPKNDRIYSERTSQTITRSSFLISTKLQAMVESFILAKDYESPLSADLW